MIETGTKVLPGRKEVPVGEAKDFHNPGNLDERDVRWREFTTKSVHQEEFAGKIGTWIGGKS
ncbi:hypothetical protein ACFL2Q_00675 [Thermodesulfobacteriota bacterium]